MKNYFLFILFLGIGSCSEPYRITVEPSGTKIITGFCDRQIFVSEPDLKEWYGPQYSGYQVDQVVLAELDSLSQSVSFIVFLGTWCGDSKREVPRFLKIADEAKIPPNKIMLYGVDRTKRSNDGITDKYHLLNVPTIIVLNGEKELGRIVEFPQETLEKDVTGILMKWRDLKN